MRFLYAWVDDYYAWASVKTEIYHYGAKKTEWNDRVVLMIYGWFYFIMGASLGGEGLIEIRKMYWI